MGLATVLAAGFAAPADALDVAPIETTRWGLSYDVGATSLGGSLAIGPLRVGTAGYVAPLPGLGPVGGMSASAAMRMWQDDDDDGLTWGVGVTGYVMSTLSSRTSEIEGYGLHPTLIGTLPLGDDVVLRGAIGPLLFTGSTDWSAAPTASDPYRRVRHGATGFLPVVPNLELVIRLGEGSELSLGGFPSIVGWRYGM